MWGYKIVRTKDIDWYQTTIGKLDATQIHLNEYVDKLAGKRVSVSVIRRIMGWK